MKHRTLGLLGLLTSCTASPTSSNLDGIQQSSTPDNAGNSNGSNAESWTLSVDAPPEGTVLDEQLEPAAEDGTFLHELDPKSARAIQLQRSFAYPSVVYIIRGEVVETRTIDAGIDYPDLELVHQLATCHDVRVLESWKAEAPTVVEVCTYGGRRADLGASISIDNKFEVGDVFIGGLANSHVPGAIHGRLRVLNGEMGAAVDGYDVLSQAEVRLLLTDYAHFDLEVSQ